MLPDRAKFLRDMLDSAKLIQSYTTGYTLEKYLQNRMTRDSVHWNFCVIGEALSQVKRLDPQLADQITDSRRIIGLRNQLIHGYGVVDDRITWNIIEEKLPVLIRELEDLLQN